MTSTSEPISLESYASNCKKQKITGLADSFLIIKRRSARKALLFL